MASRYLLITVEHLTKRFGDVIAVDDLSFEVGAGQVTGFLGPNGAGKSTTMRLILGLDKPTEGVTRVNGQPYSALGFPLREVGALLDAGAVHPARSAANHLRWMAKSNGLSAHRVDEVLEVVGLTSVAGKRVGGFSLGMKQRLGVAASLLGDPAVLIYDEPVNGLDPEGIVWIRRLLQKLAGEGRTVLVSSHLMNEMAVMAERVIVIGKGRLIADASVEDLTNNAGSNLVKVRTPEVERFVAIIREHHADARLEDGAILVAGATLEQLGELAAGHGIVLHELSKEKHSLEAVFMEMTASAVEYRGGDGAQS